MTEEEKQNLIQLMSSSEQGYDLGFEIICNYTASIEEKLDIAEDIRAHISRELEAATIALDNSFQTQEDYQNNSDKHHVLTLLDIKAVILSKKIKACCLYI